MHTLDPGIAVLETTLAQHPTSPAILGKSGRLFEVRRSVEQAITTYERPLEVHADNAAVQAQPRPWMGASELDGILKRRSRTGSRPLHCVA